MELWTSKDSVCSGYAENTKSVLNMVFLQYHLPKSLYFPVVSLSNTIMAQKIHTFYLSFLKVTYYFWRKFLLHILIFSISILT